MKARLSRLPPRSWPYGRRGFQFFTCALLWLVGLTVGFVNRGEAEDGGGSPDEIKSLMGMSLDQLLDVRVDKVYGASKYEQKISQAPASISIVTSDEIKKQGYRTLAEILRSVRGLYITGDRAYSYLGVRGFGRPSDYNSRVLVLVDGHRMNDNIYDSALLGTEGVIDVDLIERVEVIRGSSSSIYGGRFSYGNRFTNGIELVLSGTWSESAGERRLFYREYDQPASNNGIAEDSDGDRYYRFFGKLAYSEFTLSGAWSERTKNIPTASFGTIFNDGGEKVTDRYGYLDLKYEHVFSGDIALLGKVYYDDYEYSGDFPFNTAAPGNPIVRVLNRDLSSGQWAGMNWQLTAPVGDRAKVVVGTDFRGDLRQHRLNYDVSPRAVYRDEDTSSWNTGIYAQGELAICTNLIFSGGVRFDYYETFGSTINPRLALIYSPWTETNFKLLYGQAYRAPNSYELSSGSLDPETIHTYEAVYEQELPAHLRFIASGYYYRVDELISDTISGFQNVGRVNARGMELELEGRYPRGLTARLSYALQRSEDDSTGSELSNSPRHLAKGSLIAPLYKDKIFAGLELQYTGSVLTNTRQREDDYLLANVTLFSQKLARGLEVSASIYNLFDARYAQPVSTAHAPLDVVEQSGRSFRVKLTYKF